MSRALIALVIGNATYDKAGKLKNPGNDANDIADKLETSGFRVFRLIDANCKDMERELANFKKELNGNEVGLFFFAGHGFQIEGSNYLAAIDTQIEDETEAKYSSLSLDRVIESMENSATSTNIIILDACRDNPWDRVWRGLASRGLAPVYAPKGTLIAFATSPGQVAADGRGRNGAYTSALLQHIETPGCSIEIMFKRVRNTLSATTSGKQISWEHTSLSGEFYFNLSIGNRITEYDSSALRDGLFVLDGVDPSHQLIGALRSHHWYTQTPAVDNFTADSAAQASKDSLFVVGRNIYQAACGNSRGAENYINNFMQRTQEISEEKRKAILDGMLFEIFFGPDGVIRSGPKLRRFNEVFHLQDFIDLLSSFNFIKECLIPYSRRFYSIPGMNQECSVDVIVNSISEKKVTKIFVDGTNVLRVRDPDYADDDGLPIRYVSYYKDALEEYLAEEMIVPRRLLKFTYNESLSEFDQLEFPRGWTVRRPLA